MKTESNIQPNKCYFPSSMRAETIYFHSVPVFIRDLTELVGGIETIIIITYLTTRYLYLYTLLMSR
jgi:hypothetical protein